MTAPAAESFRINLARPGDEAAVVGLIHELATYEKMSDQCAVTEADIRREAFGPRPSVEILLARLDERAVACAIFFQNFSTFVGRPGLFLEDLFVQPEYRRFGIGTALLKRMALLAVERGYGRFEWACLEWNELANDRYRKIGAAPLEEWRIWRLDGERLEEFARS